MKFVEGNPSYERTIEVELNGNNKTSNKRKIENETDMQQSSKWSIERTKTLDTTLTADVSKKLEGEDKTSNKKMEDETAMQQFLNNLASAPKYQTQHWLQMWVKWLK